ncbi:enoyl-CoA hydratase/isomerase family protein [Tropicibacter naphthalenivorans]|uniref:4-chlorobenzoyl coenzyme A dehalogenase-1 n=1 Tax=Tropicibacter naphthalenivorans TaxID=441103 RepID=A0A0P1GHB9_9RHOB|nr:enoyl-CoA hydratase/isomerase family protein [Tropicibacter naphthalenivorans]CUH81122.1 4-chlorobenzoyl coenzyme A dehalogenase-1 [Tropicibacter naphthalenivorans]SMC97261.1 Enoyl-CoA hydratase [Tropicibacter naphthalenivorans]
MTDTTEALRLTRKGGIALIEMTQPQKRNPLNNALKQALDATLRSLEGDKTLTAVILTGSGGVFSGGGDLKAMARERASGEYDGAEDYLDRMRHTHGWLRVLRNLPVPVIAAVDGPAAGAGLAMALACDLVLVTDRAQFSCAFCKVGLVPDVGLFHALPRAVGLQRARELMYTGRAVGAEEAVRIGIALEIVSPEALMDRAWDMARQMEQGSRAAFSLTKDISGRSLDTDAETLLSLELQAQAILLASRYNGEAVTRFSNKEPLRFNFK